MGIEREIPSVLIAAQLEITASTTAIIVSADTIASEPSGLVPNFFVTWRYGLLQDLISLHRTFYAAQYGKSKFLSSYPDVIFLCHFFVPSVTFFLPQSLFLLTFQRLRTSSD